MSAPWQRGSSHTTSSCSLASNANLSCSSNEPRHPMGTVRPRAVHTDSIGCPKPNQLRNKGLRRSCAYCPKTQLTFKLRMLDQKWSRKHTISCRSTACRRVVTVRGYGLSRDSTSRSRCPPNSVANATLPAGNNTSAFPRVARGRGSCLRSAPHPLRARSTGCQDLDDCAPGDNESDMFQSHAAMTPRRRISFCPGNAPGCRESTVLRKRSDLDFEMAAAPDSYLNR